MCGRFARPCDDDDTTHDHWIIAASLTDIGLGDTKPLLLGGGKPLCQNRAFPLRDRAWWERENDIIGVRRHRGALHELRVQNVRRARLQVHCKMAHLIVSR